MEQSLGAEYERVMHALIPYFIGGSLDLYYYPGAAGGTAVATKELSTLPGEGSHNKVYHSYELVMFTRQPLDLEAAHDEAKPFGRMHHSINAFLNCVARHSAEATLNPLETCEFPAEMEKLGGRCLVFDGYAQHDDGEGGTFGLLAVIEVFRSEMDFARQHGTQALLHRLKQAGHYPFSDMDREAVA